MTKLKLLVVPASRIAEDNAAVKASQETANPLSRSRRFNTNKHKKAEVEEAIPDSDPQHGNPPWMPYSYALLHSLIAESQGLANSYVLEMPSVLCDDLMLLHCSWMRSDLVPSYLQNPLVEDLKSTKTGQKLMSLLDGKQRWFIRLDQMSPKDSPLGGELQLTTIQEGSDHRDSFQYARIWELAVDAPKRGETLGRKPCQRAAHSESLE